jgi:thiosulfate dehydrogenase [quinone] large subunit
MSTYTQAVSEEFKKGWWKSILVVIFTIARLIFGWAWLTAGWEKLSWLSGGKFYAGKEIQGMIANIAGPKVTRFDPLGINQLFAWIAKNIFYTMGGLTDALVVICEIVIGVFIIIGFRVFWSALIAFFLNLQYIAAGSYNNFGYIWADLAFLKFDKYAELIGLDGYLRYKRGKDLL